MHKWNAMKWIAWQNNILEWASHRASFRVSLTVIHFDKNQLEHAEFNSWGFIKFTLNYGFDFCIVSMGKRLWSARPLYSISIEKFTWVWQGFNFPTSVFKQFKFFTLLINKLKQYDLPSRFLSILNRPQFLIQFKNVN